MKFSFYLILFTLGAKSKVVSFAPGTDESDKEDKHGNKMNKSTTNLFSSWFLRFAHNKNVSVLFPLVFLVMA